MGSVEEFVASDVAGARASSSSQESKLLSGGRKWLLHGPRPS